MTFFGITDPWIIAAYIGCFATTAFCVLWGLFAKVKEETTEEGDD